MRRDGSLEWRTETQRVATVSTKTTQLLLSIVEGPNGFGVIALEMAKAYAETPLAAKKVFDNHSHAILGKRKTQAGAEKLASEYAKKWLQGQRIKDRCDCEEIRVMARQNARKSA